MLSTGLHPVVGMVPERGSLLLSWHQPAIDAYVLALMLRFNRQPTGSSNSDSIQPLVYQTYQAYLRRTPAYLRQSLTFARERGFALGVKLVRGAYHPHETAAHGAPGSLSVSRDDRPPVWPTKAETDASYDECVGMLVDAVAQDVAGPPATGWLANMLGRAPAAGSGAPAIGVLFGTHNRASCDLILSSLAQRGLAQRGADGALVLPDAVAGRVALAQLYGMHDALTNGLVDGLRSSSPVVLKYVPYGALKEVRRCLVCVG
jgi:proline dehydrogenase